MPHQCIHSQQHFIAHQLPQHTSMSCNKSGKPHLICHIWILLSFLPHTQVNQLWLKKNGTRCIGMVQSIVVSFLQCLVIFLANFISALYSLASWPPPSFPLPSVWKSKERHTCIIILHDIRIERMVWVHGARTAIRARLPELPAFYLKIWFSKFKRYILTSLQNSMETAAPCDII